MTLLVLGSSSPRRRELLLQIGVTPAAILSPDIDESLRKGELPLTYVKRMALEKLAKSVALWKEQNGDPTAVILTADTIVTCGRRVLPKAMVEEEARSCLELLSGKRHTVITAVATVGASGVVRQRAVSTKVTVKQLTLADKALHLASGDWEGKAGGYALQGVFARFIHSINGSPSGIIGLPLYETSRLLESEKVI